MRRNKLDEILSRPSKEIVISLIIIFIGGFILFNEEIDKIIKLVIGLTIITSGIYYLLIEDWKSPIFFSLTIIASGVFTVLFLDNIQANMVGYVLSMQMFLYFASLSISYINGVEGNKKFIISGFISTIVTLFARFFKVSRLDIYILVLSMITLILYFLILYILRRKESHEQLHSNTN